MSRRQDQARQQGVVERRLVIWRAAEAPLSRRRAPPAACIPQAGACALEPLPTSRDPLKPGSFGRGLALLRLLPGGGLARPREPSYWVPLPWGSVLPMVLLRVSKNGCVIIQGNVSKKRWHDALGRPLLQVPWDCRYTHVTLLHKNTRAHARARQLLHLLFFLHIFFSWLFRVAKKRVPDCVHPPSARICVFPRGFRSPPTTHHPPTHKALSLPALLTASRQIHCLLESRQNLVS